MMLAIGALDRGFHAQRRSGCGDAKAMETAACGSALFYVASMSQGIAGNVCKPLQQHGNRLQHCDMES
jgi:hypothetical protein